jgi:Xaa-Pro aminopeptidase
MGGPNYGRRLARLRGAFQEKGLDGVLLSSTNDIYYYTGKAPSGGGFGLLLVTKKSRTLFVSGLDNELEGPGVRLFSDMKSLRGELKVPGRLGYDEGNLSVAAFRRLRTGSWRPFSEGIKPLRIIKDSYEVAQLREAARRTLKIIRSLRPGGKSEFQVATEILHRIRMLGDVPAFEPLVVAWRNTSYVHHVPNRTRISRGLVIVDMGVRHNRYNADITRVFSIRPSGREERMMGQCREIQEELIEMARPGTGFSSIQKRYEKLMKSLGYPVLHSFGHGVGLGVHERPRGKDILEKGMVLTVEPGIYKKGLGGCRFEDMVLVDDKPVVLSR